MTAPRRILRGLLVAAVAASLAASPLASRPAAGCPLAAVQQPAGPHKCCCGDHCHCLNCPGLDSRHQRPPQPPATPTAPSQGLDLVKLHTPPLKISTATLLAVAAVDQAPDLQPAPVSISTLILQHTCLQV
jgi:hypothetical protein